MKSYRRPPSPCPLGALIPRVHLLLGCMACSGPCKPTRLFSISENHSEGNSVLAQLRLCFPAFIPSSPTSQVVSFLSACCGTQRQESFQEELFSLLLLSTSEELELLE